MPAVISTKVTGSIEAVITAVRADASLNAPLFAINWFDTRSLWLYNFYNFLASRCVQAVGGQVVIKGKVDKVLMGDASSRRDVLLIVRYPSGPRFLEMAQSTYFKLVGLLRAAAVSRFTFGFTQPSFEQSAIDDPTKEKAYLIHFFHGEDVTADLARIAQDFGLGVVYSGRSVARLGTRTTGETTINLPCLMAGAVVLQAESENCLKDLFTTQEFQKIARKTDGNFTVTLTRLL